MTTAEADTTHEGSALMPTPALFRIHGERFVGAVDPSPQKPDAEIAHLQAAF